MEELSIEEKAKRYDEALKYAMIYYKDGNEDMKMMMKTCFPVLVEESEDVVIKEKIIATIHLYYGEPLEDEAKEMLAWLEKQSEQKPVEWSEEGKQNLKIEGYENLSDYEKIFDNIADKYVRNKNQKGYNQSWYVKERAAEMLYQANKELKKKASWSKEDEAFYQRLEQIVCKVDIEAFQGDRDLHSWLKSLRPQNTWKPSDEQIEALEHSLGDYNIKIFEDRHKTLKSLYNDLKKLKE